MNTKVKIKKLEHSVDTLPAYATEKSAGLDLLAANVDSIVIKPGEIKLIPTGISIGLPINFEAQIRPRSGLALKHGITVLNSPGTIDADYRGEIMIILINLGQKDFIVERGMKIAQMIIARYEHVLLEETDSLDETIRGSGGFGSTGV